MERLTEPKETDSRIRRVRKDLMLEERRVRRAFVISVRERGR